MGWGKVPVVADVAGVADGVAGDVASLHNMASLLLLLTRYQLVL